VYPCADSDALSLPNVNLKEGERGADVDMANLRTLGVGNLASEECAPRLSKDIGVVGVVRVGYAAENDIPCILALAERGGSESENEHPSPR
jgi:hypothetical protein